MEKDTYKTLVTPGDETLLKEKGSKFFGYAFPVSNEQEVKELLEQLKKKHHTARHWCYAFQLGTGEQPYYRANDDGEPNNSAGMPIYGQLQSFEVTNVLVVVVRYFGGVKLGVGGLVQAYKASAALALEASVIEERTINVHFMVSFDYKNMNKVMRVIREHQLELVHQEMEMDCVFEVATRKQKAANAFAALEQLYEIDVKYKDETQIPGEN